MTMLSSNDVVEDPISWLPICVIGSQDYFSNGQGGGSIGGKTSVPSPFSNGHGGVHKYVKLNISQDLSFVIWPRSLILL